MATGFSYDSLSQGLGNLRLPDSEDQKLSDRIKNYYDTHKQTDEEISQKKETRAALEEVLKLHFASDARVHMVGSSLTNFATSSSDMDIVLTSANLNSEVDQAKVFQILKLDSGMDILEFRYGPTVKVPIIRGKDHRGSRPILWEMSFERTENILKTKLLRAYSLLDPRVAPLVIAVKAWAAHVGVKDAHQGTLSSYSWTLMVICYLQSVNPPVLPCLQTFDKAKAKYADVRAHNVLTLDVEEQPPVYESQNTGSLGELLRGFFDFYSNKFKYSVHAVSVRQGKLISRYDVAYRKPTKQWQYFCIEEPYGDPLTNTARAMYKDAPCQKVIMAIQAAHIQLSNGKILPGL